MQQLTQLKLSRATPFDSQSRVVVCHFTDFPDWDEAESQLTNWLKQGQFTVKEIIEGADRMTWRLDIDMQTVYFHYEVLSESAWFEADESYRLAADDTANQFDTFAQALLARLKVAELL